MFNLSNETYIKDPDPTQMDKEVQAWEGMPKEKGILRDTLLFRRWAKERLERPAHLHPLKMREVFGAVVNRLLRVSFALVKKETFYRIPVPCAATEFQLITV